MVRELEDEDEVIAACALCQNEECGSLVVTYRAAWPRSSDLWDFVCSRCGAEFSMLDDELVFQSVALGALLGKLPHITHA